MSRDRFVDSGLPRKRHIFTPPVMKGRQKIIRHTPARHGGFPSNRIRRLFLLHIYHVAFQARNASMTYVEDFLRFNDPVQKAQTGLKILRI